MEAAPDAPPPEEAAAAALEAAGRQRSVERSRIEMMRHYAELADCRRRFLLQYFGETALETALEPCGRCDNCDAGRFSVTDPSEQALPAGSRVDHADWGTGIVLASGAERITVPTDQARYKELAASVAISQGLLSPLTA